MHALDIVHLTDEVDKQKQLHYEKISIFLAQKFPAEICLLCLFSFPGVGQSVNCCMSLSRIKQNFKDMNFHKGR